jgi:hypothetical protein
MIRRDELDETAIGSFIYMLEESHFDLYSLWRWIFQTQIFRLPAVV